MSYDMDVMQFIRENPVQAGLLLVGITVLTMIAVYWFYVWFEHRELRRYERFQIEQGIVRELTRTFMFMSLRATQYYIVLELRDSVSRKWFVEYKIPENDYKKLKTDILTKVRPYWQFVKLTPNWEFQLEHWMHAHPNLAVGIALTSGGFLLLSLMAFLLL